MTEERRRRKAYLQVVRGPGTGRLLRLDGQVLHLGREETCDLVLDDEAVSRIHARLEVTEEGQYRLIDLDSTNGTMVEGHEIDSQLLSDGDRVVLGDSVVLRFGFVEPSWTEGQAPEGGGVPVADRRVFMNRLAEEMKTRPRQLAVAIVEPDGRETGEQIPGRLRETVRSQDFLGKVSSRQWAVLFPDLGLEEVERVLERVRMKILDTGLRVSLGVTGLSTDPRTPEELMLDADMALAKARLAGGNQVQISWPPLEAQDEKRHKVRLRCEEPVTCKLEEEGEEGFTATVRDVSPHGMGLVARRQLANGSRMLLEHEGGGPVWARVVRSRERPGGEFLLGLAYDERLENLRISWLRPYLRSLGFAGSVPLEERRHQVRLELQLPGSVVKGKEEGRAWLLNLSLGGAMVRCLRGFEVGDSVELETTFNQQTLRTEARVVGAADAGTFWRLNLAFEPLNAAQQQWVARMLAGQKKLLRKS